MAVLDDVKSINLATSKIVAILEAVDNLINAEPPMYDEYQGGSVYVSKCVYCGDKEDHHYGDCVYYNLLHAYTSTEMVTEKSKDKDSVNFTDNELRLIMDALYYMNNAKVGNERKLVALVEKVDIMLRKDGKQSVA